MSQPHWACPRSQRVCPPCPHSSGSRLFRWKQSKAGPGLHAPPRSKPLRFRPLGSPQRHRLCWACVLCPSPGPNSSGDAVFGKHGRCDLSPPRFLLLSFLGVQTDHLLRRMLSVQNPKKSWLAMKPACNLVDNASVGPRLPPSGSGCPRLPVTGEGRRGVGRSAPS